MSHEILPPFWHPAHCGAFILDWDGVLADTRLDFKPLRQKYFEGKTVPLLEAAEKLPRNLCEELKTEIRRIEIEGAAKATPIVGAKELIDWLNRSGKPWAVVSRNCRESIFLAAERCGIELPSVLLSREEPHIKPAPEALALAAKRLKANLCDCVMVGDFIYDLLGARRAAIRAVLVQRSNVEWDHLADVAYATVKDFVESLLAPTALVPWEYHDLAAKQGADYLKAVNRRVYRLSTASGAFRQALELIRLGAARIEVPEDAVIDISDWKESSLPAQTIDMPLNALLRDVAAAHWPCVKILSASEASAGLSIEVPPLGGSDLQNFIFDSVRV